MDKPFISPQTQLPEITLKVVCLSILLTVILAMSNAYLALKVGILASASIPAAIMSMGILRLFKHSNILENNLVQTAASAGEAVAGGIVYTIPALIMMHYWQHFSYWENVFIAATGGLLGVLFSIPLRKVLVTDPALRFPEGRAIAEVLIAGSEKHFGLKAILSGGLVGACIELAQMGFHILAESMQGWWGVGKTVVGFGCGFSATMIGIGYIVGTQIGVSIFIGAVAGWLFGIPIFGLTMDIPTAQGAMGDIALGIWLDKLRYIGIGAMLVASLWTLVTLTKPFMASLIEAMKVFRSDKHCGFDHLLRTERDIPIFYVFLGILALSLGVYSLFHYLFPLESLQLGQQFDVVVLLSGVFYVVIIGIIFSAITGYFSGMVGVTASPGSAIIIAGLLLAAVILRMLISAVDVGNLLQSKQAAAAITIFLGGIITGAAAIANDNMQDLKVGHIVGATPWKQQIMLMLGVVISALVIPWVMELLFQVYGIGDVLPHEGMNIHQALPAPPAAMMATVTQAVFDYAIPWYLIGIGALVVLAVLIVNWLLPVNKKLSVLGVAVGIYLPLATSTALFLGSLLAYVIKKVLQKKNLSEETMTHHRHRGVLIACGLVSGTAIMNILLAMPFAYYGSPDLFKIISDNYLQLTECFSVIVTLVLCYWIYKVVSHD